MSWANEEWKDGLDPHVLHKIDQLERQAEQLRKENQQKRFQMETLDQSLRRQKQIAEKEKETSAELRSELQVISDINCSLEQKLARCESDQARHLATERNVVCSLKQQNAAAQMLLKGREKELRSATDQCTRLGDELEVCRDDLINLQKTVEKCDKRLTSSHAELHLEKERSADKIKKIQEDICHRELELSELRDELQREVMARKMATEHARQLALRLSEQSEPSKELVTECNHYQVALTKATTELEDLKAAHCRTMEDCRTATELAAALQKRLDESEQLCRDAASEMGPLCDQLACNEDQLAKLTVEKNELLEHSNAAQALLEQLESARQDIQQQYDDLLCTVEAKDNQQQNFSTEALAAKDKQLSQLESNLTNLSSLLHAERDVTGKVMEENIHLQSQLDEAAALVRIASDDLLSSRQELEQVSQRLVSQSREFSALKCDSQVKEDEYQQATRVCELRIAQLTDDLQCSQKEMADRQHQLDQLSLAVTNLKSDQQCQQHSHQAERDAFVRQLEETESWKQDMISANRENDSLKATICQLQDQSQSHRQAINELQQDYDRETVASCALRDEVNHLHQRLRHMQNELSANQEQSQALESGLEEERGRRSAAELENKKLSIETSILLDEVASRDEEIALLQLAVSRPDSAVGRKKSPLSEDASDCSSSFSHATNEPVSHATGELQGVVQLADSLQQEIPQPSGLLLSTADMTCADQTSRPQIADARSEDLEGQQQDLAMQLQLCKNALLESESVASKLKMELGSVTEERDSLTAKLNTGSKAQEMHGMNTASQDDANLAERHGHLLEEHDKLQTSFQNANAAVTTLQRQLHEMRVEMARLKVSQKEDVDFLRAEAVLKSEVALELREQLEKLTSDFQSQEQHGMKRVSCGAVETHAHPADDMSIQAPEDSTNPRAPVVVVVPRSEVDCRLTVATSSDSHGRSLQHADCADMLATAVEQPSPSPCVLYDLADTVSADQDVEVACKTAPSDVSDSSDFCLRRLMDSNVEMMTQTDSDVKTMTQMDFDDDSTPGGAEAATIGDRQPSTVDKYKEVLSNESSPRQAEPTDDNTLAVSTKELLLIPTKARDEHNEVVEDVQAPINQQSTDIEEPLEADLSSPTNHGYHLQAAKRKSDENSHCGAKKISGTATTHQSPWCSKQSTVLAERDVNIDLDTPTH